MPDPQVQAPPPVDPSQQAPPGNLANTANPYFQNLIQNMSQTGALGALNPGQQLDQSNQAAQAQPPQPPQQQPFDFNNLVSQMLDPEKGQQAREQYLKMLGVDKSDSKIQEYEDKLNQLSNTRQYAKTLLPDYLGGTQKTGTLEKIGGVLQNLIKFGTNPIGYAAHSNPWHQAKQEAAGEYKEQAPVLEGLLNQQRQLKTSAVQDMIRQQQYLNTLAGRGYSAQTAANSRQNVASTLAQTRQNITDKMFEIQNRRVTNESDRIQQQKDLIAAQTEFEHTKNQQAQLMLGLPTNETQAAAIQARNPSAVTNQTVNNIMRMNQSKVAPSYSPFGDQGGVFNNRSGQILQPGQTGGGGAAPLPAAGGQTAPNSQAPIAASSTTALPRSQAPSTTPASIPPELLDNTGKPYTPMSMRQFYGSPIVLPVLGGNLRNIPDGHTPQNDPVMNVPSFKAKPSPQIMNKAEQSLTGYQKVQQMRKLIASMDEGKLGTIQGLWTKYGLQNTSSADPQISELTNLASTMGAAHGAALSFRSAQFPEKVQEALTKLNTNKGAMLTALKPYEDTFTSTLRENPWSKQSFAQLNPDWNEIAKVYHPDIYNKLQTRRAQERLKNAAK